MQAIVTTPNGELELATVPEPQPLANEVLIEVAAIGVNPVDWKTRDVSAPARALFDSAHPVILGWDMAGTVAQIGAGVTRFAVGDRVFGMPKFPRPAGAYAELAVAGGREVARTPDGVSDVVAGALPLAGLTAWQALVDTFHVTTGDRVLIHAASGGVGHLAVQIAKAFGAEVWATASGSKHEQVRRLGADHLIDHRTERFEEVATDMDYVLDLYAGGDNPTRSVATMRPGGAMVTVAPDNLPAAEVLEAAGVTATWMLVEPDHNALEQMAAMLTDGTLTVEVAETRPLAAMDELHRIGQGGTPFGKLVATVER